jgi:hypothetical protein
MDGWFAAIARLIAEKDVGFIRVFCWLKQSG